MEIRRKRRSKSRERIRCFTLTPCLISLTRDKHSNLISEEEKKKSLTPAKNWPLCRRRRYSPGIKIKTFFFPLSSKALDL
jgi:hypothetical protein